MLSTMLNEPKSFFEKNRQFVDSTFFLLPLFFLLIIGLIVNTISVFSIKELPEEELKAGKDHTEEKYGLIEAAKLLFSNKYYLMICATYICQQIYSAMLNMGIYYMIYILKNENL